MNDNRKDLGLSYEAALHGVQSAIAYEMARPERYTATEPKHMRVGIDSAHVSDAALAFVLIQKGLITEDEYLESLRLQMNNELAGYNAKHEKVRFR